MMVSVCLSVLCSLFLSTLACRYKGNTYENNETWKEKGAFKMLCIIEPNGSWRTEVAGCLAPDGQEVAVNTTKSIDQHDWSCLISGDGHITLKQEMGKNADCAGGHKRGTTWVDKSFEFECIEGGVVKFLGCVTSSGTKIRNGETKEVSGILVECKQHENGTISLNGVGRKQDADCTDSNGQNRKNGEKWVQNNHFEMTCEDHGKTTISGCVIGKQAGHPEKVITINSTETIGKMTYTCEQREGSYKFYNKPNN